MLFRPFAMESLGGLAASCTQVLKFLGKNLADIDKTSPESAANKLHDKIVFWWMKDLGTSLASHASEVSRDLDKLPTSSQ